MKVKNTRELPPKIEKRLADLVAMGEFNLTEVEECRRGYWNARDEWHTILINCYDRAQKRQAAAPPA